MWVLTTTVCLASWWYPTGRSSPDQAAPRKGLYNFKNELPVIRIWSLVLGHLLKTNDL